MELSFSRKSVRLICQCERTAKRSFGLGVTEKLKSRLADLRAADSLTDIPTGRFSPHPSPDGQEMTVELCDGYTLTFRANHTKVPVTKANRVDWARVSRIKIMTIGMNNDK